MSIEAVKEFSKIAKYDSEIQKSLESAKDLESLISLSIKLGSHKGFSFTANDVEKYYSQSINMVRPTLTDKRALNLAQDRDVTSTSICKGLPYLAYQMCLKLNLSKEK